MYISVLNLEHFIHNKKHLQIQKSSLNQIIIIIEGEQLHYNIWQKNGWTIENIEKHVSVTVA